MSDVVLDYEALLSKATAITEKRIALTTCRDELVKQQEELKQSLVTKFGADYMDKFHQAKAAIEAWELANAS